MREFGAMREEADKTIAVLHTLAPTGSIVGYHGTSEEHARRILSEGFSHSRNEYDWLGDGVYFFQDAPHRALAWAAEHHGNAGAVLQSCIRLVDCIDLLDIAWFKQLTSAYDEFLGRTRNLGIALPRQTSGAHRLDRHVINYMVGVLTEQGIAVGSVRAAFIEGEPVFPGSAIYDRAHVQVAVRDLKLIAGTTVFIKEEPDAK